MLGARAIPLWLCLAAFCVPLWTQTAPRQMGLRLVSAEEGELIVQAAWELRHGLPQKPDCSHFVHDAYNRAGFPYEYAASRDIFTGIHHFQRVTRAQPGDVIVWQGHIGIVIDPNEHYFYSSTNSGFAIENYSSHYWMGRGNTRFYRFIVNDQVSPQALFFNVALVSSSPGQVLSSLPNFSPDQSPMLMQSSAKKSLPNESAQARQVQKQQQPATVANRPAKIQQSEAATKDRQTSDKVLVTSLTTPSKESAQAQHTQRQQQSAVVENRPAKIQPSEVATKDRQTSDKVLVASLATPTKESVQASAKKSLPNESTQAQHVDRQQQPAVVENRPAKIQPSEVAAKDRQTGDKVLVTSHATPSKEEVLTAVLRSVDANGKRLLQGGSLDSQPSVGVVESFRIVAINLQGSSGLADLEVRQMATFQYGKAVPARTTAVRHVILSRQEQAWVMVMPQDLICLNRYLAVTALTDHLATLASAPANDPERKNSQRLLNELLAQRARAQTEKAPLQAAAPAH